VVEVVVVATVVVVVVVGNCVVGTAAADGPVGAGRVVAEVVAGTMLVELDDGAGASGTTSTAAPPANGCAAALGATTVVGERTRAGPGTIVDGRASTPTNTPPSTASPMTRSAIARCAPTRPIIRSRRGLEGAGESASS
jgi:hypothetical protein